MYRHFIVVGEESLIAAMGAECAAEQDSFWAFHDTLFENWSGENEGAFAYSKLQGYSDDLGMNAAEFTDCMENGRGFNRVKAHHEDAMSRGIDSTPTVLINGERVFGSYQTFQQAIEAALQAAE